MRRNEGRVRCRTKPVAQEERERKKCHVSNESKANRESRHRTEVG